MSNSLLTLPQSRSYGCISLTSNDKPQDELQNVHNIFKPSISKITNVTDTSNNEEYQNPTTSPKCRLHSQIKTQENKKNNLNLQNQQGSRHRQNIHKSYNNSQSDRTPFPKRSYSQTKERPKTLNSLHLTPNDVSHQNLNSSGIDEGLYKCNNKNRLSCQPTKPRRISECDQKSKQLRSGNVLRSNTNYGIIMGVLILFGVAIGLLGAR